MQKTQMNLDDIMLGEINCTEKSRYCMILVICGIKRKKKKKAKPIEIESRMVVSRRKWGHSGQIFQL